MKWDEVVQKGYDKFLKDHQDLEYVVRCRDCKHSKLIEEDSDVRYCYCHHMFHFEDYYCADGKRKENAMKCKDCKNHEHWFGDTYRCVDSGTMVFDDDICPYWHEKDGGAE